MHVEADECRGGIGRHVNLRHLQRVQPEMVVVRPCTAAAGIKPFLGSPASAANEVNRARYDEG
jgi:hypothetical protein